MQCSQNLSIISSMDWEKNHWSNETSPAFWVWARFAGSIFILPNTARSCNTVQSACLAGCLSSVLPLQSACMWVVSPPCCPCSPVSPLCCPCSPLVCRVVSPLCCPCSPLVCRVFLSSVLPLLLYCMTGCLSSVLPLQSTCKSGCPSSLLVW